MSTDFLRELERQAREATVEEVQLGALFWTLLSVDTKRRLSDVEDLETKAVAAWSTLTLRNMESRLRTFLTAEEEDGREPPESAWRWHDTVKAELASRGAP